MSLGCLVLSALIGLAAEPGQVRWEAQLDGEALTAPALGLDGAVYVATAPGRLWALDSKGLTRWVFSASGYFYTWPVVGGDGTIYVGNYRVYAVSPEGRELWRSQLGTGPALAVSASGRVYASSLGGSSLHALDRHGGLLWQFGGTAAAGAFVAPAIYPDGSVLALTNTPQRAQWSFELGGSFLWVLSPEGEQRWRIGGSTIGPVAIRSDGTVLAPTRSLLAAVFSTSDGRPQRYQGLPVDSFLYSSPSAPVVGHSGAVYFGESKDFVWKRPFYAIWPDDGRIRWQLEVYGAILGAAVDLHENVYFGTSRGAFLAVDTQGQPRWELDLGSAVGIPALAPDGTIYVGTAAGKLFAIQGEAGPDNSSWPQFQRNAQHTGSLETYLTVPRTGQVTVHGIPSRTYRLEVSHDLAQWTVWTNVTLTADTQVLDDPAWGHSPARLYRAVLLP